MTHSLATDRSTESPVEETETASEPNELSSVYDAGPMNRRKALEYLGCAGVIGVVGAAGFGVKKGYDYTQRPSTHLGDFPHLKKFFQSLKYVDGKFHLYVDMTDPPIELATGDMMGPADTLGNFESEKARGIIINTLRYIFSAAGIENIEVHESTDPAESTLNVFTARLLDYDGRGWPVDDVDSPFNYRTYNTKDYFGAEGTEKTVLLMNTVRPEIGGPSLNTTLGYIEQDNPEAMDALVALVTEAFLRSFSNDKETKHIENFEQFGTLIKKPSSRSFWRIRIRGSPPWPSVRPADSHASGAKTRQTKTSNRSAARRFPHACQSATDGNESQRGR